VLSGREDEDHTDINESWNQASTIPILRTKLILGSVYC